VDAEHFDTLVRTLSHPVSRRVALGASLAGVLGTSGAPDASATSGGKGPARKRPRRRKGKSRAPTCRDGKQNGGETDVDCGGSCPRCVNGQRCRGQDDCDSGLCVSGVCRACVADTDCGIDAAGPCRCDTADRQTQQRVCNNALGGPSVSNRDDCPEGTNCHRVDLGEWVCRTFCGVP
jgi:hypothetical protein